MHKYKQYTAYRNDSSASDAREVVFNRENTEVCQDDGRRNRNFGHIRESGPWLRLHCKMTGGGGGGEWRAQWHIKKADDERSTDRFGLIRTPPPSPHVESLELGVASSTCISTTFLVWSGTGLDLRGSKVVKQINHVWVHGKDSNHAWQSRRETRQ